MPKSPLPLNLPCPLAATTVPVTGVPARMTLTPWTTTDWANAPVKVSPTLLFLALSVCPTRTTSGAPMGTTYCWGGGGGGGVAGAGGGGGGAALCAGAGAGAGAAGAASGVGAVAGGGAGGGGGGGGGGGCGGGGGGGGGRAGAAAGGGGWGGGWGSLSRARGFC